MPVGSKTGRAKAVLSRRIDGGADQIHRELDEPEEKEEEPDHEAPAAGEARRDVEEHGERGDDHDHGQSQQRGTGRAKATRARTARLRSAETRRAPSRARSRSRTRR